MFDYQKYGPYVCIGAVLAVLFVLWAFCGGKDYDFVGLAPLNPDTCGSYSGSVYNWGNITPAIGYDPVEGHTCVPPDGACIQETTEVPPVAKPAIIVDNTPAVPDQFLVDEPICPVAVITPEQPVEGTVCPVVTERKLPQPRPSSNPRTAKFKSRGERLCCQTMERIYGVPFVTVRPNWLLNDTGRPLELDCYNEDLQLAVEYNGEQHYKWPNFTNQSYEEFLAQLGRDQLKVKLCDRNGVYLITVPYNIPYENIPAYITSHLPETIQKRLQEEQTLA